MKMYFISELLESYGYLELDAGNNKKAKRHLRHTWENPNENVITHAEWIIRNKAPEMRDTAELDFLQSPEAKTWVNYFHLNLKDALDSIHEWELEEPYSKYPLIVGSCMACNAGKPELGIDLAKKGLLLAPNDRTIYNNLCYALLMADKIDETKKYIEKIKQEDGSELDLYCKATHGLFNFKLKNIEEGRSEYLDVISKFKQRGDSTQQIEALLNLTIAELDAFTQGSQATAIKVLEVTEQLNAPTITLLRKIIQNKMQIANKVKSLK